MLNMKKVVFENVQKVIKKEVKRFRMFRFENNSLYYILFGCLGTWLLM